MSFRGKYLVLAVVLIVAVFVVLALVKGPAPKARSEQEFLQEVHQRMRDKVVAPTGDAPLPPVPASDDASVPSIEVETTHYDMGVISNSEKTVGQLFVRNEGEADLVISKVKTTCGCTKGTMDRKTIPPGEQAPLTITVDPFRIGGFKSKKTITLYSNDAEKPLVKIDVLAEIKPEVSIEPQNLEFGKVPKGERHQRSMLIKQLGEEPLEITAVHGTSRDDTITFTYERLPEQEWTAPNRAEYRVTAALAADAPVGPHRTRFVIDTNLKRLKRITGMFTAEVEAFYELSPRNAPLGTLAPGATKKAVATISADRPFEIVSVSSDSDDFDAAVRFIDEPNTAVIDVAVKPSVEPGVKRDKIRFRIKAGDKTYEESVGVTGVIRQAAG